MRRISITALVAAPLLLFAGTGSVTANPPQSAAFFVGCSGACSKLFPHIHQHGPLYNYGPYYGYYPFAPYGPWDQYLRYDPNFYGQPSYGHGHGHKIGGGSSGCSSCGGFFHASWLQGGWFKGHTWLSGSCHSCHKPGCNSCEKPACSSCGGVATAVPVAPSGNPAARYTGFGTPTQSAVFYTATPTLDPTIELAPTAGRTR